MRRKKLYRCMLVLFAVIMLLQGWSMRSASAQVKEETMEKSGAAGEGTKVVMDVPSVIEGYTDKIRIIDNKNFPAFSC